MQPQQGLSGSGPLDTVCPVSPNSTATPFSSRSTRELPSLSTDLPSGAVAISTEVRFVRDWGRADSGRGGGVHDALLVDATFEDSTG